MADEIKPEVKVAAKWWADQLRSPSLMDNGDGLQSIMATLVSASVARPTESQIEEFRNALERRLEKICSGDAWNPSDPEWGGGRRVLCVDYHPSHPLDECMEESSIGYSASLLPIKTVMWVNPGSVMVAKGYGARAVEILKEGSANA